MLDRLLKPGNSLFLIFTGVEQTKENRVGETCNSARGRCGNHKKKLF